MIEFDNEFKAMFNEYYGDITPLKMPNEVHDYILNTCSNECLELAFNLAKACYITNMNYQEYYGEAAKRLCWEVAAQDLDKFLLSIAFYYTFVNERKYLENFFDTRFVKRNILQEVADADGETVDHIINKTTEHTYSIQLPTPESRDKWFYDMTLVVGSYAKCHSRKIGAVLVRDNSVISTGYNGPPRGIPDCDQRWYIDQAFKDKYGHHLDKIEQGSEKGVCPRRIIGFPSGKGLEICPAGHAERNALINAARLAVETKDTKLYMSCGVPCTPCMVEIINAGVEEIICTQVHPTYDETAMYLLENSDLKIRLYDFLV